MIKRFLLPVFLFSIQHCFSQPIFQLAPPLLNYESGFFSGSTSFEIIFNQPGAKVHYTLNGQEPTGKDPVYSGVVSITKRTTVKAKAFGENFLPSETVNATFIKNGKAIRDIKYSKPNESYVNSKADILNDNVGGITNYRSGGWIGYDNDTVTITIDLAKKETIKKVLINLLQDENSWIFLPEQILVYNYNDTKKTFVQTAKKEFQHTSRGPKQCKLLEILPAQNIKTDKLKLVLLPLKNIPGWHNGKGNHGWLFIDEIKVY